MGEYEINATSLRYIFEILCLIMYFMRKLIIGLAFCSISSLASAADNVDRQMMVDSVAENGTFRFTLDECLQYAFSNNFERQRMILSKKSAEESVEQAKAARRPNLNFSTGESAHHQGGDDRVTISGNAGLSSGISIYEGGSITNNIKRSKLEEEDAMLQTEKYDNSLSIEILNAYLNALRSGDALKLKSAIVGSSREQAEMGKVKYDAGSILESDYLVLEAQFLSNQTDTLDARISQHVNLLQLKRLMSMAPEAELSVVEPDTSAIEALVLLPSRDECVSKALQSMPDLKLTASAIEIAEVQTQITKAGRRPNVSASAGIGTSHRDFDDVGRQLGDNFYQQAGVNLSWALYDRGITKSRLAQSKYSKLQAELNQAQTELSIRQTVIEQYDNVKLAYERYKMTKKRCDAYAEVYKVYSVKFNAGSVVITDLLQQETNYISAINEYIQAKYALILNRKILDVYMGEKIMLKNY